MNTFPSLRWLGGFQCRADEDVCLQSHQLRIRLDAGEPVASVYPCLPDVSPLVSAVVSSRIHKLMFQLGQEAEQGKDWLLAKTIYKGCHDKRARHRLMRVHEQLSDWSAAYAIAVAILQKPVNEAELQATQRALPRLSRQLKRPVSSQPPLLQPPTDTLRLTEPPRICVEVSVAEYLTQRSRQAHYVENTLLSSLFGLVFWDTIFAPVPGAFFNSFQAGPADVFHPEFASQH